MSTPPDTGEPGYDRLGERLYGGMMEMTTDHRHRVKRMKVRLHELVGQRRRGGGGGFGIRSAVIAQNGRVDAVREVDRADVGVRADPVVVNGLVRVELNNACKIPVEALVRVMDTYNERVTLSDEDLDAVHLQRLGVDGVGLNDGHRVVVDAEHVVRVARDGHETEPVPEETCQVVLQ